MKNILMVLILTLITSVSYAQDFNLQLRNVYGDIYESLSGVIVITDGNCDINDYEPVVLHHYNNPYTGIDNQSSNSTYTPFSGLFNTTSAQLKDNFTYTVQEAQIVNPRQCYDNSNSSFGGAGDGSDCVPETFDPYIDYVDVVKSCKVYGVARLSDTGQEVITYDSRSVYDATSGRLYLFNTEIWNHLQDSGTVFSYVQLKVENGAFVPEILQATPNSEIIE